MKCTIDWNVLSLPEWNERFASIRRSNLLQSYDYARAMCPILKQKARWGLIKLNGKEAGLVQVLEAGIFRNLIHALHIDRGPLWFEGYGHERDFEAFMAEFMRQFPKRWGSKIRIIPEMADETANPILKKHGLSRLAQPYQTIYIDLTKDEDTLRSNLKKNWRNMLSRAEREGLSSDFDLSPLELLGSLILYLDDKNAKEYDGLGVKDIMALSQSFMETGNFFMGQVLKDEAVIAFAIFFMHGTSATYQVGWTSDSGKKIGAQNKLLFDAMLALKRDGITDLDLGGVNDETAKGVKQFKEGMGGRLLHLGGLYR